MLRIALISALAVAACAHQTPPQNHAAHGRTIDLQGGGADAWAANPHMDAFYELSRRTLGRGVDGVDVAAYEERSFEIFRAFARSMGAPEAGMIDHLKLIPRQMVQIVAEDPKVLDSYANFRLALMGPE